MCNFRKQHPLDNPSIYNTIYIFIFNKNILHKGVPLFYLFFNEKLAGSQKLFRKPNPSHYIPLQIKSNLV